MLLNLSRRITLRVTGASAFDEAPNVGMTFYATEKAPARGAFPEHDVQLFGVVEYVLIVCLRRKGGVEIT